MESCWWFFHVHLCRSLFVVPGAWVPNSQMPIALLRNANTSTSLGWAPLKLGRLIANGSQAVPLFEPQQTHTLKRWPGHRLVKIGWATRPSIAKWQFQNSFLFFLGVWVKLVALLNSATVLWVQRLVASCTFATLLRSNLSFWLSFVPPRSQTQQKNCPQVVSTVS